MRIGIDALGGDNAPLEVVKAVKEISKNSNNIYYLYGDDSLLKSIDETENIKIVYCEERILNEDNPVIAIRRKKKSSLVVGMKDLKEKKLDGFLSAGNTGAILTAGMFILGRLKGVQRPAICTVYPTMTGFSVLNDAGASIDSNSEFLYKQAILSTLYAKEVLEKKNPTIGLVNVGIEETKGGDELKKAYKLLQESNLNFIGNIEGRDVAEGKADIILTDGFTGNIILKLSEGLAKSFGSKIKDLFKYSIFTKLSSVFFKNAFNKFKKELDYREYGGAPLLGMNGCVVKAHGSSDAYAFLNAIKFLEKYIESDILKKYQDDYE